MIQAAMMFALGFFVSGLFWLAFSVALVRRAQRLTERRLLASISTRRAEFETERDELRARHAVQMYRLEREVSRVLDMATAHRLEADVKEHDLASMKAELVAREEELQEMQARLAGERDLNQDLERRHAEAGSALRTVQHALQLEISRRVSAEGAADEGLADERRQTLRMLRAENDALRAVLTEALPEHGARLPRILTPQAAPVAAQAPPEQPAATGGSVVQMPTRPRNIPETPDQSAALIADGARDLQRLAGEAHADLGNTVWRAPAHAEPRMPIAPGPGEPSVAELVAHRLAPGADKGSGSKGADGAPGETPETRFFEALAEIRALRRAASQAGE